MDNTETHYVTFDPDSIYREMLLSYIENGGDVLYPGDEKEILLRCVQSLMVQMFAGVDNALRMATLRYAVGDYLDLYGEKRGCYRIAANAARAVIEITFRGTGTAETIPAGSYVTGNDGVMYVTDEDVRYTGYNQTARISVTAAEKGAKGNALTAGTQMQMVYPYAFVQSVTCITSASGGQNAEEDESYRERIRVFGIQNSTTGPKEQYEAAAMAASADIIDAEAASPIYGNVDIRLLMKEGADADAVYAAVLAAVNSDRVRPLTDRVTVHSVQNITYNLIVQYSAPAGSGIAAAVAAAAERYQTWQDNTIGRAFNPDRLRAELFQAGAERVLFGSGSSFHGSSTIEYTTIDADERCKGTITLEAI